MLNSRKQKLAETLDEAIQALPTHVERDHARIGNDRAHGLSNGSLTHRRTGVLTAQARQEVGQRVTEALLLGVEP